MLRCNIMTGAGRKAAETLGFLATSTARVICVICVICRSTDIYIALTAWGREREKDYSICNMYNIYNIYNRAARSPQESWGLRVMLQCSVDITYITLGNRVPVAKISHFFGFRECGIGGGMVERIEANTPPSRRIEPAARRAVPAAALTDAERQVLEIVASEGLSTKAAFVAVFPHAADWPAPRLWTESSALRRRGQAYLAELVSAGAEEAAIGRATLIQMALQDREFARETGNASAAVAATKNVAALCGISMKEPGDAGPTDPVALLEAVERLMRANRGDEAVVIDHGSNGE